MSELSVSAILKTPPEVLSVLVLREAAVLAAEAYSSIAPVVDGYVTIPFTGKDAEGFAILSEKALFLIFCGTNSRADIFRDADARLIDDPWGKIHSGFHAQWMKNKEQVFGLIDSLAQDANIYCIGHSLGSATACLCVADILLELHRKVYGLILFGTPKIGDKEYVKTWDSKFSERCWSVINGSDGVVLGPRYFTMSNIGRIVRINSANQIVLSPQTFAQRIKERIVDRVLHGSGGSAQAISDHLMKNYIASLAACCEHAPAL